MGSASETDHIQMQVLGPTASFVSPLPKEQWTSVGSGEKAQVALSDPTVSPLHLSLRAGEDGKVELQTEAPTRLNEVQLNGRGIAGPGDEIRIGQTRLILCRHRLPSVRFHPQLARHRELRQWLMERPLSLVLAYLPEGPPVEELQPLLAAQVEVPTRWAQYGQFTLAAAVEDAEKTLDRIAERMRAALMGAGCAHRLGWAAGDLRTCGDAVIGRAMAKMLGLPAEIPLEQQVVQDAVRLRLRMAAESLSRGTGWVLLMGEDGVGRQSLAAEMYTLNDGKKSLWPNVDRWPARELEARTEESQRRGEWVVATAKEESEELRARFPHILRVPALRDRPDELPTLAQLFLTRAAESLGKAALSLSLEAKRALLAYDFPGNVRELKDWMERAALQSDAGVVGLEALPEEAKDVVPENRETDLRAAVRGAEREVLLSALRKTQWNVTQAARELGLPRRTVVYRIAKLGLRRPDRRGSRRGR